jgi:hypothetical protein
VENALLLRAGLSRRKLVIAFTKFFVAMAALIAKEQIPDLRIVPAFVDRSAQWTSQLRYSCRLGNEFKGKTLITFETTSGPKSVETTVWSVTDNHLTLKGGVSIPLSSVIEVSC